MADPWESIIRDEQKVAKDRSQTQSKPRNVLPNVAVSPGLRERIISGLMGIQAAQAPIAAASKVGDPFSATLAGLSGVAGAPSPQDLVLARQKQEQEAQMVELDMTPISQVSPGLAEAFPELADLPLGQFQKLAPILERQDRFQKGLAAQELRYRLMLEGRDLTDAEEKALVEMGLDPQMVKGIRSDIGLALARAKQTETSRAGKAEVAEGKTTRMEEARLRNELRARAKEFFVIRDSFNRVEASAKNPTPAGDLSMIFNYMKILDPGSVVRESEFKNAETAAPLLQRVGLSFDKVGSVWEGKKLTPGQRQDFLNRAGELFRAQQGTMDEVRAEYRDLATAAGVNPANVDVGFRPGARDQRESPIVERTLKTGEKVRVRKLPNGQYQRVP